MPNAAHCITLMVRGLDSEEGHVKADGFADQLDHLLGALNGIDKIVGTSSSPRLYYRIVNAGHNSPLHVTLEPILKKPLERGEAYIDECHRRFFSELKSIRTNGAVSPDIDENLLEHLRDVVLGRGKEFRNAEISNEIIKVELDDAFETGIRKLLNEQEQSYGGIEGSLEAANIHPTIRRFWIYPRIGPRIRCDYLPGAREQVREALGSYVRVEGIKFFRSQSPYPFRVAMRDLIPLPESNVVPLKDLLGIAPRATGELGSVEFVRALRNEWER